MNNNMSVRAFSVYLSQNLYFIYHEFVEFINKFAVNITKIKDIIFMKTNRINTLLAFEIYSLLSLIKYVKNTMLNNTYKEIF